MNSSQILIQTCEWFGKNFAWNLNALPDDKLSWKPAPSASSSLEITHHTAEVLRNMQRALEGGAYHAEALPMPTTREEAQDMIIGAANDYADYLGGLQGEQSGDVELPWGAMPRARCLAMPVQDLVHHHGQIAYIQTILGDEVSHFFEFEGG